jgi:hypothetical protein
VFVGLLCEVLGVVDEEVEYLSRYGLFSAPLRGHGRFFQLRGGTSCSDNALRDSRSANANRIVNCVTEPDRPDSDFTNNHPNFIKGTL